ncbi:hypothetical protein EON80_21655 [bacterium]|nr:MAG: hypothetical protein EON80_21655 [bacterium]
MNVFLISSDSHQSQKTEEAKASASPLNSLLRLNGRTSLYWTAKALAESNYIRSICVICDKEFQDELRTELPQDSRFRFEELKELDAKQPDQQTPLNESIQAIEKVAREMVKTPTMVVSCTAPHWTGKTYNDVISHFRDSGADSALFYVKISDARMKTPFFKALIQVLQCAVIGPGAIDGFVAQVGRFSPEIQKLDAQSSARR